MKPIVLYGSSRRQGNSELLADRVLDGIPHTKRYLMDLKIQPIVDQRHSPAGFADVDDDYDALIQEVLAHDALVLVTPLYWYGMSGLMKNFVDRWSQSLRQPGLGFRERMQAIPGYVVIAGGDHPHEKAKPLVQQFQLIFDFMGMSLDGWVIGEGNRPGDVLADEAALRSAAALNQRLRQRSAGPGPTANA
ncbi:flavodoxin family protein [Alicyclobacillus contaminans]|uniref:flavodoxin family protein n=1 Tax=Alicyclobacillus contaminans TaxID=392016 RepID=UPI0005539F35|nr:flavodoxin family protein [Alicyclobacillus contaminans]